ncbi:MAG: low affinity iron permease family protein [Actinomycetota bacterium]|nr:low affinity iron permease family protein [Actinomycetota bacterium]
MDGEDGDHIADEVGRQAGRFTLVAARITSWSGSAPAAAAVMVTLGAWVAVGLVTGFDHSWQAVVNVILAFLTLLMLVLIQHTQNHDDQAVQLKLDELIRATDKASNQMMLVEEASDQDLKRIRKAFEDEASE